ncbi:MAG: Selenide, water dikinase [candidate division WS2 bacterium]|nr:Selenide, water dikinase [Candidatus Lithacetigena glycinireducens]MBT9174510.1 Selenide, water dikinase [Candidatus Lithacetigena glycinireducens]
MVQTVDMITPILDDPYDFGQVVAANAISDIYTMGCLPELALNIIAFPCSSLPIEILSLILAGGQDKAAEAGVLIGGGHTIEDVEIKYGMVVTGFGTKDNLWRVGGAKEGDVLILTKPIGTGIVSTALKAGEAPLEIINSVADSMKKLNNLPVLLKNHRIKIKACTDVTGFGLMVHALSMINKSKLGIKMIAREIPIFKKANELALSGFVPGGAYRNEKWASPKVIINATPDNMLFDPILLYDPQTSGGLLVAVEQNNAELLLLILKEAGFSAASIIGSFVSDEDERIEII